MSRRLKVSENSSSGGGVYWNEFLQRVLGEIPEGVERMQNRRRFLKIFGFSSAGVALAGAMSQSKAVIDEGGDQAKEEIEKLKKAYEELDARSKLILRLLLFFSGIDILTSIL
ncbi:MAG: hypothetical protein VYA08_13335 [Pseudomonadota bacterium]|nr:hypothetical protein [Pseudomonadota bacterium]